MTCVTQLSPLCCVLLVADGPVLALRPKPAATTSNAPREAWEQALEGHED